MKLIFPQKQRGFLFIFFVLFCLSWMIPITVHGESNTYITVQTDRLNVRSDPSLDSRVIKSVSSGEIYPMVKDDGEWIQIRFQDGETGWVASYLVSKNRNESEPSTAKTNIDSSKNTTFIVSHNGTNIRTQPSIQSTILDQANKGDVFYSTHMENDWYEVRLANGQTGYIAGWLVAIQDNNKTQKQSSKPSFSLQNKKIVIDPGHGGNDNGTTGYNGTLEKRISLDTAIKLYSKLKEAGANVYLTRNQDYYLSLPSRVNMAYYHDSDAFISIHYDSFQDRNIRGITTYFYHSWQKNLAQSVHTALIKKTNMNDRGIHIGDYYVIRENNKQAILLELGYLSNPSEEKSVSSNSYQELAATGIYEGLVDYFKE